MNIDTNGSIGTIFSIRRVYERALEALGASVNEVLAIEDLRNGLLAALACWIMTIVTPSTYSAREDFTGAGLVCPDLDAPPVTLAVLAGLVNAL